MLHGKYIADKAFIIGNSKTHISSLKISLLKKFKTSDMLLDCLQTTLYNNTYYISVTFKISFF